MSSSRHTRHLMIKVDWPHDRPHDGPHDPYDQPHCWLHRIKTMKEIELQIVTSCQIQTLVFRLSWEWRGRRRRRQRWKVFLQMRWVANCQMRGKSQLLGFSSSCKSCFRWKGGMGDGPHASHPIMARGWNIATTQSKHTTISSDTWRHQEEKLS